MGRAAADCVSGQGGGPAVLSGAELSDQYGELFRDCWWPAVAVLTRITGDLETAEDAVQDACALALTKWPDEPEVTGLLALLLLTDARREARTSDAGELVLLSDQDRGRWNMAKITEGTALLGRALKAGRPGPY
ncbi:MAG: DUF6596 domain-containing protein [Streptosporangiaceae bacterium]